MVDADQTFVIVGGGLAGAKAAETLRTEGFTGRVILICDERDHPYERPPLSKGYLLGKEERDSVFVHEPAWYARNDIELHLGETVDAIDRAAKTVRFGEDGTAVRYDKLLLATGAEPRRLDIPGTDLAGVHHLRRLAHAERLKGVLAALGRDNGHLVIAGAGWIGLEVAAAAREYGAEVTVVEPLSTPLHSVLGPELGNLFAELHRERGVRFHFGARLTEIVGQDGMVLAARTDDGEEHPAHDVLAAVGAAPRTALAEAAGLELADRAHGGGIAVDGHLRTSDPDIYAAGDVASFHHALFGNRLRVEHWANALNGGPAAARAMLGRQVTYDRVPYFFSDQYDLGMEYSGWAPPGSYDEVVIRGDAGKREFIAFWVKQGRVLAGMNVNVWDVTEPIQALIRSGAQVDTEALADPHVPLVSLVP
ncbi:3-phenylpropionate/trans-cinnamate dioxygenase ferredoxin reductase subunit [Streptomyces sp. SAI-135]|uniref:NAD(P)/FAD-dependent oxidoreductase n=1 Tax=unclassified Streptomyces TaxID=2593676 RepID=UPI0024737716|nr:MULTISPECIES: FAD-dependent oxidoreductase [unclassified Streptomyces]MDH6519238.1 3-phenylpropionate/trans-cinnamate dioxygenase ferredoxin reductase subunit [Streptomyces sp. SAI-090]MDH6551460.1 3-phenylpropionate/trans-cinnamate dioxygenase ferredoxin reductase subunit [Streptomyces sp. SAI-041]MDH6584490.1 3-phenylpropionate/trans-cinnamate dioxygenase ferredoxin reductase subunit [Streptomyces sp. SAI-133]MDH6616669.1 3-phenylpropionate/trans-cinnamate dioxygenase ferredoxin reductase 